MPRSDRRSKRDRFDAMPRSELDALLKTYAGDDTPRRVAYIRSVLLSDDAVRRVLRALGATIYRKDDHAAK